MKKRYGLFDNEHIVEIIETIPQGVIVKYLNNEFEIPEFIVTELNEIDLILHNIDLTKL